jgi:hypothetical protein
MNNINTGKREGKYATRMKGFPSETKFKKAHHAKEAKPITTTISIVKIW